MKKVIASIVLATVGALGLSGCGGPHGSVIGKMYVPAYATRDSLGTPTLHDACWELVIGGEDGGNECVSQSVYKATLIGTVV